METKIYEGYDGVQFAQRPLVLGQIKRIASLVKNLDIAEDLLALGIGGAAQPVYNEDGSPVLDDDGTQAMGIPGFDPANLPPLIGKLGESLPAFLAAVLLPPGKTPRENRDNAEWIQSVEDGLPAEIIPDVVADFFSFNLGSSFLAKMSGAGKKIMDLLPKAETSTSSTGQSSGSLEETAPATT